MLSGAVAFVQFHVTCTCHVPGNLVSLSLPSGEQRLLGWDLSVLPLV